MKNLNAFDRILLSVWPAVAEKRAMARMRAKYMLGRAGYDAAGGGRRWFRARGSSQNAENRRQAAIIRDNVRELERNNPYIGIAIGVIQSRTIGTGMKPKAKHPTNKTKQKRAQHLINDWAKSTACDAHGKMNLYGLQSLAMRTIPLSGEALIMRHFERDPRLEIPLKLDLMECDYIDSSKDTQGNTASPIVQGVELSKGRPSKFHIHEYHPGDNGSGWGNSTPIDADRIAHAFEMLRPGQVRGLPWGYNVLTKIKGLDDFQDARIEQQRMAACLMGYTYSDDAGNNKGGPLPTNLAPGIIANLASGEQMGFNTPPSVSGQGEFVRGEEHLIASAYGITYEALTGDYSTANFASGKMGSIQMYTNIERWQKHVVCSQMLDQVGRWFNEAAAWQGIDLEGVTYEWTPPKKQILDLKNELPAIVAEVRAGLNSLQNALRERGYDAEEIMREMKEDQELMDSLGLVLDIDPRKVNKSGQLQQVQSPAAPENKIQNDDNSEADSDAD